MWMVEIDLLCQNISLESRIKTRMDLQKVSFKNGGEKQHRNGKKLTFFKWNHVKLYFHCLYVIDSILLKSHLITDLSRGKFFIASEVHISWNEEEFRYEQRILTRWWFS